MPVMRSASKSGPEKELLADFRILLPTSVDQLNDDRFFETFSILEGGPSCNASTTF
ncbi:hypothetical protein IG631_23968 [Alternaria alternata]|nr:hypothetical protein IG631_23968 [Alternaria alternata]